MSTKFIYGLLIMLSFSLMSSTCSKDDDINTNDNSVEINQIKATVQSGSWRITSFIDSGTDETSHFTGYSFTFNSNGTLTASNGSNTFNGTWSVTDSSNGNDDSNSNSDIDFNIYFATPANFNDDLTEDWDIELYNSTKIQLIHVSGGNGGTDTLTFEKI
ncbi:hypothetical protein ACFQ0I_09690 [Mariniflexile aquimaris]|uniref:Lipocalin-like domain-containing protein n=1 Tax=Mariniflexile aquimaris TaxID=881009 RepID=A0ABW3BSZ1_9FLAO